VTKGEKEKFRSNYSYSLNNHKDSHQFFEYYLRNIKGEYVFYMLGKNGEAQDDINVTFQFEHFYMGKSFYSPQLTTDPEGKVYLGPLEGMYRVRATVNSTKGQ